MTETPIYNAEGLERRPLKDFSEKSYLDYSMYVILDRALPHVGDGLKPVQRRILYAMSELGLSATAKFKKSARTVGDVLGKFHPHGDSACYEAMVLMAQDFSYRYPLVDGQGNWGSPDDPKSFAAMRYTESRLTPYSEVLLAEVGQGTVDWQPNFDGTLEEPVLLPARLPNLLLNGATGIAVGMATDIPSHNLREIARACIHLLKHPDATPEDLFELVPGPDFPTAGEIVTPPEELLKMYKSGYGSVRMRARYQMEHGDVVVTALPYQVSGSRLMQQIDQQFQAKKLPMLEDYRDESDHEYPTRLVLTPRSNRVDIERMMSHLFATTDLEKSYRVNMNTITLNGRPQVMNLREILLEWLTYRTDTVRRRLDHRLTKVLDRLHLLDGLLIAFLNIDEVIRIIRSEDHPKPVLMERFALTDVQAEYVLNTRLRQLARLEEMKIRGELQELEKERAWLESTLASERLLKKLIRDEIEQDAAKYGDERRSPLKIREAAVALGETELTPSEPVTVVLSEKGWVRSAKGHEIDPKGLTYKAGDRYLGAARVRSNQQVAFLDSCGRSYSVQTHTLPSARGQGEPLTGRFSPPQGAQFIAVLGDDPTRRYLLASDAGYGFLTAMGSMLVKSKTGKALLTVPPAARVLPPVPVSDVETDRLAAVTSSGHLLVFPVSDLPELARGKGNKVINIPAAKAKAREEVMMALTVVPPGCCLIIHSGKRHFTLKASDLDDYQGERGRRGRMLPRGFQRVDSLEVGN